MAKFKRKPQGIVLTPTRPSIAIQRKYERKLKRLIEGMHKSTLWWVRAEYRKQQPRLAMDASPVSDLLKATKRLLDNWTRVFETEAKKASDWFAKQVGGFTARSFKNALKKEKVLDFMTVDFAYKSKAEKNLMESIIASNVSLITSIPRQYFGEIEGLVQRSVQSGRDLSYLTKEIAARYPVTLRRASYIARDQNDKATEALNRQRALDLGAKKAIWVHTSAGKTYRKSHIAMDGQEYDLTKGCYDPDSHVRRHIHPGELPGCKCTMRPVFTFGDKKGG